MFDCPDCNMPEKYCDCDPPPIWEDLEQLCEHWVSENINEEGGYQCGRNAKCRVSFDNKRTWLYLCKRHAKIVEKQGI